MIFFVLKYRSDNMFKIYESLKMILKLKFSIISYKNIAKN